LRDGARGSAYSVALAPAAPGQQARRTRRSHAAQAFTALVVSLIRRNTGSGGDDIAFNVVVP